MYEYELYHWGVKGMKWGVRRYQNKDGSLTPAGKKRYSDDGSPTTKKKSKHRIELEEGYRKLGLTREEAERQADARIRTEKILAASAAVTVGACAAFVANKKIRERIDQVIKAGEQMQRIEMQDTGGQLHDMFYVAKGKRDTRRYKNMLGMTRQMQTGEAYVMKLEAAKDIKVASQDRAAKMFGDLYKNDAQFRNSVQDIVGKHFAGKNRVADVNNLSNRNIKKMYENFNSNIAQARNKTNRPDNVFFEKLKSAGYGAVQDINDMKYSGYRAKNPLIVFDKSGSDVMVKSYKKMEENMMAAGSKELLKVQCEDLIEKLAPVSAAVLTKKAVTTYRADPAEDLNQ